MNELPLFPVYRPNATDVHQQRVSSVEFRRASEREDPDALPGGEEGERMMRVLEEALDKERARLGGFTTVIPTSLTHGRAF